MRDFPTAAAPKVSEAEERKKSIVLPSPMQLFSSASYVAKTDLAQEEEEEERQNQIGMIEEVGKGLFTLGSIS